MHSPNTPAATVLLSLVICILVALPLCTLIGEYLRPRSPLSLRFLPQFVPAPARDLRLDIAKLRQWSPYFVEPRRLKPSLLYLKSYESPGRENHQRRVSQRLFDDSEGEILESPSCRPYFPGMATSITKKHVSSGVCQQPSKLSEYAAVRFLGWRLFNCIPR